MFSVLQKAFCAVSRRQVWLFNVSNCKFTTKLPFMPHFGRSLSQFGSVRQLWSAGRGVRCMQSSGCLWVKMLHSAEFDCAITYLSLGITISEFFYILFVISLATRK